jgi:hypothetical protein
MRLVFISTPLVLINFFMFDRQSKRGSGTDARIASKSAGYVALTQQKQKSDIRIRPDVARLPRRCRQSAVTGISDERLSYPD